MRDYSIKVSIWVRMERRSLSNLECACQGQEIWTGCKEAKGVRKQKCLLPEIGMSDGR